MTAIDDLNDIRAELNSLRQRVRELETGTPQQSMSITEGRMRFIGGLLRIDSGGRVEVVGFLQIEGQADIIGPVNISGDVHATGEWTQVGPWHLNGTGSIAGDADITGTLTLLKDLIVSSLGKIEVQGTNPIRLRQVGGLARMDLGDTASIWSGGDGVTINATNGGAYINVYSGGIDLGALGKTVDISGSVRMPSLTGKPAGVTLLPVGWDPATRRLYVG